jgi:hypothetical protein
MKLKKLSLHSLPGFRRGFEITDISPRLNVIIGPNASGKTSICQAVRRLLWPDRVKHFLSAWIHSEWSYSQDTFTVEVKDGNLAPNISQSGQLLLERLPEEHLISCFSMTIDELFDGKDEEFAQRISREIAGGYDVEAAQKHFVPSITPRTAIKDWETAEACFERYKRTQDTLRKEGGELPALERDIKEAEGASVHASDIDKIIKLKRVHNKIIARQNDLNAFPKQLILAKIRATDWENYEQLIEQRASLGTEIESLQNTLESLEVSVGKWREIVLPEGELDRQMDLIQTIQRLDREKTEIQSGIDKLESDVNEHRRLLGISSEEDIGKIQATHLADLEEDWASLEQLNSKIEGIEAQIRLNDAPQNASSEALGQAAHLLSELASNPYVKSTGFWMVTIITLVMTGTLFFLLTDWMRLCAFSLFIPLGFLWMGVFRAGERHQQLKNRYNELGLPPLKEWTLSAILQQLNRTVIDWGAARQIENQLQRKKR